jgi:hypothetical protein
MRPPLMYMGYLLSYGLATEVPRARLRVTGEASYPVCAAA